MVGVFFEIYVVDFKILELEDDRFGMICDSLVYLSFCVFVDYVDWIGGFDDGFCCGWFVCGRGVCWECWYCDFLNWYDVRLVIYKGGIFRGDVVGLVYWFCGLVIIGYGVWNCWFVVMKWGKREY